MAGIEKYKNTIGAKALKKLMLGKPVNDEDLQAAVADQHFGKTVLNVLRADKPKNFDEWDVLVKRLLSYEADAKEKYEALGAIDPNIDIHSQAKDRWGTPFTLSDAYEDRPPVQYIVRGIFEPGSLSILYGAPGSMKSMIAGQLIVDILGGFNWLEKANNEGGGFQTIKNGCLWLDFDNGKNRTHERFKALGKARGLPEDAPLKYYSMAWPILDAADSVQIAELMDRIRNFGSKIVVIDNLGIISGSRDENTSQMQEVIAGLRRLADETNAAIIVIHHSRKTSGFNNRAGDGIRGHSSIEAGLDLALLVTREDKKNKDDKNEQNIILLRATKVRGASIRPFSALFTYIHEAGTDRLEKARFFGIDVEDPKSDATIKKAILDVVQAGTIEDSKPQNIGQVVKQVMSALPGSGDNKIRQMIKELITDRQIKETKGDKNATLLTISTDQDEDLGDDEDD